MNNSIALGMICRGNELEAGRLKHCLNSIASHVDGIFITLTGKKGEMDKAEQVCKEFKVNVSYNESLFEVDEKTVDWCKNFFGYEPHMKAGDKLFLFDEARNFNMAQIPKDYDWMLWLDTDDIFRGGEKLRGVAEMAMNSNIEAVYFNYVYQAEYDEHYNVKQVIIEHLRERLMRNTGVYKWIAPIHETLIEQRPTSKTDNYDCFVLHTAEMGDRMDSLTRNLKNLELSIYQTKGEDPRHVYYLAKAFFDLGMVGKTEYDDKAIPLIFQYLTGDHKSGWPEERAQACEYLAEIYRRKGEHSNAIKACMNALIEAPEAPSIYVNLALIYAVQEKWETSLFWLKLSTAVKEKKTTLVRNPRDLMARAYEITYNCMLHLGRIDEAFQAMEEMRKQFGDIENVKVQWEFISKLREQRDVTKKFVELAEYLKTTGEWAKLKPLLASAPAIAENTPFIIDLKNKNLPPKPWRENEIAIYCGPGFTLWSPKSLENPGASFVGGSEESVICMSRELAKIGWKVTVFADPGTDEGIYDGVEWLPYFKFNTRDNFNIVIAWRQLGLVDQNINAKKTYIWNHDIINPLEATKERMDKITKMIVLSKWHRENIQNVPDEKIMISSNGI